MGWSKDTCLSMKTHENADTEQNKIDFCWGVPHENLHNCYSTTVIDHSPQQAYMAGYREGVKMSLDRGNPISADVFSKKVWPSNLRTLAQWMSVGADVENGKYAMLGARVGCYDTVMGDTDVQKVSELDELAKLFSEYQNEEQLDEDIAAYGESIRRRLDIPVAEYNAGQSKFFKFAMPQHRNRGVQDREAK